MRKLIDSSVLSSNKQLMIWFIMCSFPESYCPQNDVSLMEFIQHNYDIDISIVHDLTNYFDGVFDVSDGYVDDPKSVVIILDEDKELFVEFHPGDTLYIMDDQIFGSTGPHYSIRKIKLISFLEFLTD